MQKDCIFYIFIINSITLEEYNNVTDNLFNTFENRFDKLTTTVSDMDILNSV